MFETTNMTTREAMKHLQQVIRCIELEEVLENAANRRRDRRDRILCVVEKESRQLQPTAPKVGELLHRGEKCRLTTRVML